MAKKIVILNGSPRKNGNTSALTAAFQRGAEEAGNTVTEFHLSDMNINGCLGCWGGGKDFAGKDCALITCCEEADMSVMDGVRVPMERTAALLKWNMVGEVLVPGVLETGAIDKTDGCKQAAALAEKF